MDTLQPESARATDVFTDAAWYDRTINWSARLEREIPVLTDVLGPPGAGGILDAGCGTGRQACALAERGYRVVGADASPEMLQIAECNARNEMQDVRFVLTPFATLFKKVGGGFDGVYCLGNALAAAGTRKAVRQAVAQFARCLRPGGRLMIQILNFPRMRSEVPCIRGPRVATVDGIEYVSFRHFVFRRSSVQVINVTCWRDSGWKYRTHTGILYAVSLDQLREWCAASGLRIDHAWGGYTREVFDPAGSTDLLLVATRTR